jgi:hypothetical protein
LHNQLLQFFGISFFKDFFCDLSVEKMRRALGKIHKPAQRLQRCNIFGRFQGVSGAFYGDLRAGFRPVFTRRRPPIGPE